MKQLVKNIFIILNRKERTRFINLVVLDIIISLLDIFFLAALLYIVHFYTSSHLSANDHFIDVLFLKYPVISIIVFFLLFSIKNYFGFVVFRGQFVFVYDIASRLSKDNLSYYLNGSYRDHINIDSSVHNRKISQQPLEFGHYIVKGVQQIISQFILIVITIAAVLFFNPLLFPLLILILTPPVILTFFLLKRKLTAIRKTAKTVNEKSIQHLQEALSGYVESNIYNRKEFFVNRYIAYQSRFNNFLADQLVIQNMPSRLIEVFAVFGLFILLFLNSITSHAYTIPVITIGAFIAAAYKIIPGIVKILNSVGQINTFSFVITDLLEYNGYDETKKVQSKTPITSIRLKNIFFNYADEKVLIDFCCTINKGDIIGLSGISGKGKTTIINLLLGFLTPNSGSVFINDTPVNTGERQHYWNRISYVRQQSFFIHDSILNNITLDEKKYNAERLNSILKTTGLDELIDKYPEGINKTITENGKNISGGQRQRIMIARALYKNADVIILDEPFNELDRDAENILLYHFRNLALAGKIIILITHQKESLSFCNKIISLDEKHTANIYNY